MPRSKYPWREAGSWPGSPRRKIFLPTEAMLGVLLCLRNVAVETDRWPIYLKHVDLHPRPCRWASPSASFLPFSASLQYPRAFTFPACWPDTVMAEVRDDKAPRVVPFILERLAIHQKQHESTKPAERPPFFIGLNGVQGAGKTVLVSILQETLEKPPHNLPTVVFSLDDLYLTHEDQEKLAEAHPDNPLLQHRGQPSTHDIPLAMSIFRSLKQKRPTAIPQYDKARFDGQGERVADHEWELVNKDPAVRPPLERKHVKADLIPASYRSGDIRRLECRLSPTLTSSLGGTACESPVRPQDVPRHISRPTRTQHPFQRGRPQRSPSRIRRIDKSI